MARLAIKPSSLRGVRHGVERESLRVNTQGKLSSKTHPLVLGSALTHPWITTDYAEQLIELITPVNDTLASLFGQLEDLHRFTHKAMDGEVLWPFSMPCFIQDSEDIHLAHYGSSNIGRMKTLYRQGLKHRYGSMMQVIAGVHFNFSLPDAFWQTVFGDQDEEARQASVSEAYFGLIRNYYRFGWLIPYLFGSSPALLPSFLKQGQSDLSFQSMEDGTLFLPYATSLRLSDLGYTNSAQRSLKISFNGLDDYLQGLAAAMQTSSEDFAKIGLKDERGYRQLNTNVLQIENELYAPIRPKRVIKSGEKPSEALKRAGVEYIEVRSLDVNPYSPTGLDETQARFLDLFLIWCALSSSDLMNDCELQCWRENWNRIILEGRKPGLLLTIGCEGEVLTQAEWGLRVFDDLLHIAKLMDIDEGGNAYQQTCETLRTWLENPEKTLSARVLKDMQTQGGYLPLGCQLAAQHAAFYADHQSTAFKSMNIDALEKATQKSIEIQQEIEAKDALDFDQFLMEYFKPSVLKM